MERLTKRQREIARYVFKFCSTHKEVANALNIEESTVQSHLRSIYRILKVSNKTSLIAYINNHPEIVEDSVAVKPKYTNESIEQKSIRLKAAFLIASIRDECPALDVKQELNNIIVDLVLTLI